MAELDTSSGGGHKGSGVKKSKKMSTRVDLTPMVDLGFLLITFFMFATTLSTPKAAKFRMPKDDVKEEDQTRIDKETVMNALPGEKDRLYYYEGDDPSTIALINYTDLRKKLIAKKGVLKAANYPDSVSMLTIKPLEGASYGNFMDILDEVTINKIGSYIKVTPSPNELEVITKYNEMNNIKSEPKK
jgi:biopolymer transport protein ExbD